MIRGNMSLSMSTIPENVSTLSNQDNRDNLYDIAVTIITLLTFVVLFIIIKAYLLHSYHNKLYKYYKKTDKEYISIGVNSESGSDSGYESARSSISTATVTPDGKTKTEYFENIDISPV